MEQQDFYIEKYIRTVKVFMTLNLLDSDNLSIIKEKLEVIFIIQSEKIEKNIYYFYLIKKQCKENKDVKYMRYIPDIIKYSGNKNDIKNWMLVNKIYLQKEKNKNISSIGFDLNKIEKLSNIPNFDDFVIGDIDKHITIQYKNINPTRSVMRFVYKPQEDITIHAEDLGEFINFYKGNKKYKLTSRKWSGINSFEAYPCNLFICKDNKIITFYEDKKLNDKTLIIYNPNEDLNVNKFLYTVKTNSKSLFDGKNPLNKIFGTTDKRILEYDESKIYHLFQKEYITSNTIIGIAIIDSKISEDYFRVFDKLYDF